MLVGNAVQVVWVAKDHRLIVLLPMGVVRVLISMLPQIHA